MKNNKVLTSFKKNNVLRKSFKTINRELILRNFFTAGFFSCSILGLTAETSESKAVQVSNSRSAYLNTVSKPVEKPKVDPILEKKNPTSTDVKGEKLLIKDVVFEGNKKFSSEILRDVIKDNLGKDLTFNEIIALSIKVEEYYQDRGYLLVQVVIPPKSLDAMGTLKLQVIEGKLGEVKVSGNKRYATENVVDTINAYIKKDEILKVSSLEGALCLLNSYSGISVRSAFSKGKEFETTDVYVEVTESCRVSGFFEINNFGSDNSGEYRFIPYISLNNLSGFGDELSFFFVSSFDEIDTWSAQANYTAPINDYGTSIVSYIGMGKNVVGNEYSILDIKGDSFSYGIGASHKMFFSAKSSLEFEAMFEWQDMQQDMLGQKNYEDNIRKLRFGGNFDYTDSTGRTIVSANLHFGLGENLGGMDDNSIYSSRSFSKADNNFTKASLGIMRVQSFTDDFYALANLTAQYSLDSLVSGEQIYFGGANTVRGQPYSCCAGDDGILLNLEARYTLLKQKPNLQLAAFFDHGESHLQNPTVNQKNWTSLSGAGVGLRASLFEGLDLRFDVAFPLGAKQNDSDDCYFYGQLRYRF